MATLISELNFTAVSVTKVELVQYRAEQQQTHQ